jgi:hypothetical protein
MAAASITHTPDDWVHVTNAAENRLDEARKGGRSIAIWSGNKPAVPNANN